MLRVRRKFYDIGVFIPDGGAGSGTPIVTYGLQAGDELLYGVSSQVLYGTVNAAASQITLATC